MCQQEEADQRAAARAPSCFFRLLGGDTGIFDLSTDGKTAIVRNIMLSLSSRRTPLVRSEMTCEPLGVLFRSESSIDPRNHEEQTGSKRTPASHSVFCARVSSGGAVTTESVTFANGPLPDPLFTSVASGSSVAGCLASSFAISTSVKTSGFRHRTPRMTQQYAHLSPQYMAGAVAKLDNAFGRLMPQNQAQYVTIASRKIKSNEATSATDCERVASPGGFEPPLSP